MSLFFELEERVLVPYIDSTSMRSDIVSWIALQMAHSHLFLEFYALVTFSCLSYNLGINNQVTFTYVT